MNMDTGPNGSTLRKHHYVTREEVDTLNRQHLDALNAQIIKLNHERSVLLSALQDAEKCLRWAAQEAKGKVKAEIVGGWSHHADKAGIAIKQVSNPKG